MGSYLQRAMLRKVYGKDVSHNKVRNKNCLCFFYAVDSALADFDVKYSAAIM